MRLPSVLLAATCLAIAPAALAQEAPVTQAASVGTALPLERVFASPSLNGPVPRGVKLSPDGRFLTMLRNRADDRERWDLWGFDRTTSQWTMLVDSLKLGSGKDLSEAEKMQRERMRLGDVKGIVNYSWSADGKGILVPLDGDLFLAKLDGSVQKLTESKEDELNPALSEKGAYLSFVRDRRLWVGPVGQSARPVTPAESSETVHWGEAEFVAQEEMARFTGYWWAPDDSRIAVQRFDDAPVGIVTRAAIGAEGTKTFQQRYPAAGTRNSLVSLYVMKPDGSERVQVDLGSNPDIYLARVNWSPDAKALYVQRMNREQTLLDMLKVDPATGKASVLFTEKAAAKSWINLTNNYRFLDDGSLVWWSERDGYGHLWHVRNGRWKQLTKGPWVVSNLVGVDQKKGRVFFTANRDSAIEQGVYALNLSAPGKIERLTETGWDANASMDKTGQTLLVSRSANSQPSQVYLADQTGKRLAWVEENKLDASHPYAPYLAAHRPAQFGTIKAVDGSDLHWKMTTPVMQPGKRYPVFFQHYGGPTAQQVTSAWTNPLTQALVAKGYIVFEIDNRGTENRGVKFASQIWHAMGSVEVEDQKAGALYLRSLPFVDPDKIATYGWSYGGYMTLKMLQADQGLYAAGIAGAPVTKWELYDTNYTERYLGDPTKLPKVYEQSNALADAAKIKDPLLVIHGMADDNVVFENSSALIAKLQAENVPFEMMLYPGYTHRVSGPKVSAHLWGTILAFLERHGVTPPK
ncbi:dipeptidyl-peptidase IV [Novosphingobium kunmingense]|uniref:Dipeptidyl-peptidase IV n=1 Tax=Novosphingobium kunmingense TaxID=1211806 RepID=A0A2N0I1C8_9SPHN|nr:DPP IV N-terminal domain-containing protein [Novosphingobium kunmingense]PKB24992.1 dipeptidyl-peptidase IV [Novosphingobium kunmingense]